MGLSGRANGASWELLSWQQKIGYHHTLVSTQQPGKKEDHKGIYGTD
jgi:hypothetical protein